MTRRRRLLRWFARRPRAAAAALLAPGGLWLLLFFAVPLVVMLVYSVMTRGIYGGVEPGFTLEHYRRFFDPLYLAILGRTFALALACTAICLAIGYPTAYVIARSGKRRHLLLFLIVLPFWTSALVRTYAMMFLLRDSGIINNALLAIGAIDRPLTLLFTPGAVLAGLVYGGIPFMILPLYTSIEKLDPSLFEAAEVLGARPVARFFQVMVPLTLPGIVAGSLLVFIPSLGTLLTSDLLGGARDLLIGNLIQNQFGPARNWPFGAAASFILMTAVLAAVVIHLRTRGRVSAEDA